MGEIPENQRLQWEDHLQMITSTSPNKVASKHLVALRSEDLNEYTYIYI